VLLGDKIKLGKSRNPSEIIWENIQIKDWNKVYRIIFFVGLLIFLYSIFILQVYNLKTASALSTSYFPN
jgi:hypothetical protein